MSSAYENGMTDLEAENYSQQYPVTPYWELVEMTSTDYHCPVCGWDTIRAGGPNEPVYDVCTNPECVALPLAEDMATE